MSLDLFASNIDDAVNYAARVSAPELPSTFTDNIDDAWNKGYLLNQSISGQIRKTRARSELVDNAIAKTGDQSFGQIEQDGFLDPQIFNAKLAEHKARRPDLELQPISDEAIQARADEIGKAQLADSAHLAGRERTFGGAVGSFLGTAGAAVTDPVNLIAFPLAAPESLGVLGTALAWGGIGAGSQAAIEALNASSMARIDPNYGPTQQVTNVLETAVGGAVLGGGIKGLANLWSRAKTGQWPRSVRDAGNVVESEAQIATTNPLPGVEGEAAHRTALNKAIDDIANGRPVDVENIVTPEQAAHIEAYHGSPHDFERFDTSRIGTGEGAQAYGHGLYFAESADVARSYQEKLGLSRLGSVADALPDYFKPGNIIEGYGGRERVLEFKTGADPWDFMVKVQSIDAAGESVGRPRWHSTVPTAKEIERVTGQLPGSLYNVRITANKDHMLDWDKSFDAQTPYVQDALRKIGIDEVNYAGMPGGSIVESMGARNSPETSAKLADAGIPGIKYLDRASRSSGEHTSNFVVFDDKNVAITHKNGKPVNAETKQSVVDQAMGLPPKQPELALTPPEPAKPAGPNAEAVAALRDDLTPAKIEEARVHPDMEETVARDLDKLMLEKPGLEVPTGVTVDAEGRTVPTTRKVEDVVAEADARSAAAKEIEACVGPYPSEAA